MESGNKKIRRFEDIVAWQKARELVKIIYKMTNDLEDFRIGQVLQTFFLNIKNVMAPVPETFYHRDKDIGIGKK